MKETQPPRRSTTHGTMTRRASDLRAHRQDVAIEDHRPASGSHDGWSLRVIEALVTSTVPHDHLHIKHERRIAAKPVEHPTCRCARAASTTSRRLAAMG
jgi:hypothetical protein